MNVEYKPINDRTPRKVPVSVQILTHMILGAAFACMVTVAFLLIEVAVYFWTLITEMT